MKFHTKDALPSNCPSHPDPTIFWFHNRSIGVKSQLSHWINSRCSTKRSYNCQSQGSLSQKSKVLDQHPGSKLRTPENAVHSHGSQGLSDSPTPQFPISNFCCVLFNKIPLANLWGHNSKKINPTEITIPYKSAPSQIFIITKLKN